MTSPNMATITASLERSLQNCTLNQTTSSDTPSGIGISSSSDSPGHHHNSTDATLDLHSQISLPYHWEQCLDLKVRFHYRYTQYLLSRSLFLFSYVLFIYLSLFQLALNSIAMIDLDCSITHLLFINYNLFIILNDVF
ncbi:hypothetical protein CsSME_00036641 [Camellia sinensis var. sinensis]